MTGDNTSAVEASLQQRVRRWKERAGEAPDRKVASVVDRLYKWACERGPWATENGDGDTVSVHRSDLLTLLERGRWPVGGERCVFVPAHHQLTTTSTGDGDQEAALLVHVAEALNSLGVDVPAQGKARILRYLLDRETDLMKDTETP